MTIYKVEFSKKAFKVWQKLDHTTKEQFKKKLKERSINPHIPTAKLSGKDFKNAYKIKLRGKGYRLVYEVIDDKLVIDVISIGRRDKNSVYDEARKSMKK